MHFFQDLGLKILARWQRANLDQSAFLIMTPSRPCFDGWASSGRSMPMHAWVHQVSVAGGATEAPLSIRESTPAPLDSQWR